MSSLLISGLHAEAADGTKILKGVSLEIKPDEKHVLMGPNGGGKSTLAKVLMGHPNFVITQGKIALEGRDITNEPPDERARRGLFLGFQYPIEVPGVNFAKFLRQSINAHKAKDEKKLSPIALKNQLEAAAEKLGFSPELSKRSLNQDFSGGEKKKAEVLQMTMLRPKFAVLDEPDSGLDVDALKYIAATINAADYPMGLLLITHYQRILEYVEPDFVHVIKDGKIVRSGDASVAAKIEESGYE